MAQSSETAFRRVKGRFNAERRARFFQVETFVYFSQLYFFKIVFIGVFYQKVSQI